MIDQELQYMYGLQRFGVKPGLAVMETLMEALDHPEKKFKSVHIAGTNGKGSTAAMIASVLQWAGYTTGLYTSPHLVDFTERIQINRQQIREEELSLLVQRVRMAAQEHGIEATFFEFTTALAFCYFADKKVDVAVIEVGLGGRLDATNVITPLVSVITTIGLDHTEILGDTVLKIAQEKAGIIKRGVPVVVGDKNPEVIACIAEVAASRHSPAHVVNREVRVTQVVSSLRGQTFSVSGLLEGEFTISLLGRYQIDNVLTSLATLHVLRGLGFSISPSALQEGLERAIWPGRMQVVSHQPLIIVDGAHNEDGVRELIRFIKDIPRPSVLVVAQKRGKHIPELYTILGPFFPHVITTEGVYEAMSAEEVSGYMRPFHQRVEDISDTKEAIARALELLPHDGFLLVTGSLYMIGEALGALGKKKIY